MAGSSTPLLEVAGIQKRFGGVVALDGASLQCRTGEVHALLGANGSGKSTLAKVVTGVVAPDAGEVRIRGRVEQIRGPADMARLRIGAVYQELSLIPQLTVAENILLGREPARAGLIRERALWQRAAEVLRRLERFLDRRLPLHEPVERLSPADQQLVEVAKALSRDPEILILDEATASLRRQEVDALAQVIRELSAAGTGILFISHRLGEVYELCQRATVLRNGRVAGTVDLAGTPERVLLHLMTGEQPALEPAPKLRADSGPVRLRVQGLRAAGRLDGIAFDARAGEIVGLGGLQGQGQPELLRALFGDFPLASGRIELDGKPVRFRKPSDAIRHGVALVPGNRAQDGLFLIRSVLENLTLPSMNRRSRLGLLSPRRERAAAERMLAELQIKAGSLCDPVATLSGGNQQKVVVGKWLLTRPKILLLDDPTKGVDVRARHELYRVVKSLRAAGLVVIISSSDDSELLALCDRILVLYEGRVADELQGERLTEQELVAASLRLGSARGKEGTSHA